MFSFFKPKWQHRNPEVRIKAIQQGDIDAELLFNIAKKDSDVNVRIEAFKQMTNTKELYTLLLHEPSDQGKSQVLKQMLTVFKKSDHPEQTVKQFMDSTVRRDFPIADLLLLADSAELKLILIPFLSHVNEIQDLIDVNYLFQREEIIHID